MRRGSKESKGEGEGAGEGGASDSVARTMNVCCLSLCRIGTLAN